VEAAYVLPSESLDVTTRRFLLEKYPDLDEPEVFCELIKSFEQRAAPVTVKIGDVYLMKLLCETIFREVIIPKIIRSKTVKAASADRESSAPH
jgi:hypothetical protein